MRQWVCLPKDLLRFNSLELRGSIHFVLYLDFDYNKYNTSNLRKNAISNSFLSFRLNKIPSYHLFKLDNYITISFAKTVY